MSNTTSAQRLVWVPEGSNAVGSGRGGAVLSVEREIDGVPLSRVWTLMRTEGQADPPALPIVPHHNHNAFLEDRDHDWRFDARGLRYYSRVTTGGCWLLLEYIPRVARRAPVSQGAV